MFNNKNNQNNYQNKNNQQNNSQNNQNNNQNQKNNKKDSSYQSKKDNENSDEDHRSSSYLINSVASATDFTGYAVTVPENEDEGENLSELFSDVPVSYKGNEQ